MPRKPTVQSILHNPRLPSLPGVAIKVLDLTRDENVNFREVADVIQNDQALSIKIIRTVNSSYFGLTRPCTSINQAIVFLGLEAVKTLVLGFSLVDSIDGCNDHDVAFDYASYWRRSLHSAVAAREIARLAATCDPEEAFLAALIQDVGMIVLNRVFRDVYIQILDLTHGDHTQLIALERKSLEMDHAEVGAAIGEMWKLPPQLTCTIEHHHDAGRSPKQFSGLVRIVELANLAAEMLRVRHGDLHRRAGSGDSADSTPRFNQLLREQTGIEQLEAETLLQTMETGAKELASLFRVNISTPAEVDHVLGLAEDLRIQREIAGLPSVSTSVTSADVAAGTMAVLAPGSAHRSVMGTIVCPSRFRQYLRSAITEAREQDGCVGVMVCEIDTRLNGADADVPTLPLVEEIAGYVGSEAVVCADRADRVSLLLSRFDRVILARLANTIRMHFRSSDSMSPNQPGERENQRHLNIGAATYEHDSRDIVTDEQKLISLAEHALNLAKSAGPGAIRVFNPVPPTECAA